MPFKKGQIGWSRGLTKYTNASIAKNANSREGMFVSEATRLKISKSCKGRTPWNKGIKGVVVAWSKGLTKETSTSVARMAKTLQGHAPWGIVLIWLKLFSRCSNLLVKVARRMKIVCVSKSCKKIVTVPDSGNCLNQLLTIYNSGWLQPLSYSLSRLCFCQDWRLR